MAKVERTKRPMRSASLFKREYPMRMASQIRSSSATLADRRVGWEALNSGFWVDIGGTIASRRCPTCMHFCTEDGFYAGTVLLVHIATRGKLYSALVHRRHLRALRQNAHINKVEEIAEPVQAETMGRVPPPAKLLPHFLRATSGSSLIKGKLSRGIGNPHYVRKSGAE